MTNRNEPQKTTPAIQTTAAAVPSPTSQSPSPDRARRLRLGNFVIGLVHLAQAVVILALSEPFDITLTEAFPQGPPGTPPPAADGLLTFPLGPAVAVFLLLAAADHLLMAPPASPGGTNGNSTGGSTRPAGSSTRSRPPS